MDLKDNPYEIGVSRVVRTEAPGHPDTASVPPGTTGTVVWKDMRSHEPVVQWDNGKRFQHSLAELRPLEEPAP